MSLYDLIKDVKSELPAEELQLNRKLTDMMIQNDIEYPESVYIDNWFAGFSTDILLNNISTVNTPFIPAAIQVMH